MKKFLAFFTQKSLAKNILLPLSVACILISALSYSLYSHNTLFILEKQLTEQTRSQLALNNQYMRKSLDSIENISDTLLNNLNQYDPSASLSYISKLNTLTRLQDAEAIDFVNYTLDTFDFYIRNYSMIDSIAIYTRNGTIIAKSGLYTKTQILTPENADVILDSAIPNFDNENTSLVWLGSYDIRDFVLGASQYYLEKNPFYVFTGICRVRNNATREDAFLVINLSQEALYENYYTYPITTDTGSVFLLDADGRIHFSNQQKLIGTYSPCGSKLTENGPFATFSERRKGEELNVFYQALPGTAFWALYEVPASTYASDIIFIRNMSITLSILTILILLITVFRVIIRQLRPIHELAEAVSYVGQGHLGYTIPVHEKNEIGVLAENFNQMSKNLKTIMEEKEKIEYQKRQHEIAALQAQINPHFILNTINTVKWMAIINHVPNISNCLTSFGKILEPLLRQKVDFYTIEEELHYLQNYVDVMNYGYGNTIHLSFNLPEDLKKCKIPRFILQPLVENAVLHGVDQATNSVLIEIQITEKEEILCMAVFSQGSAIPTDRLLKIQKDLLSSSPSCKTKTSSIGLSNINQRIKVFYGKNFGLWIENDSDNRVKTSVIIPKEFIK